MANIEVDFEVFKELTARRASESVTYNDVIRSLLEMDAKAPVENVDLVKGATFKGAVFPEGTKFRGTHKGRTYTAEIKNGAWVDDDGSIRKSPSDAAVAATGKNWNGWRFWYCQFPGESDWKLIDKLRTERITHWV